MAGGCNQNDQIRLFIIAADAIGAPLAAGATRTYTVHTTGNNADHAGGYNWISGFFAADKRFTIRIDQDNTGAPAAWAQGVTVAATVQPSGLWAVPIKQCVYGEYVRISITNTAPDPQTVLRGEAYLTPIEGSPVGSPSVSATVNLEDVITQHHLNAIAISDGTDAVLDKSYSGGRIQITSNALTTGATLQFFGTVDGVSFVPLQCRNEATGVIATQTIIGAQANEIWIVDTAGLELLRVRLNAIAGIGATVSVISKIIEGAGVDAAPDVVDLETKYTIHQNAANAIGNGTDAAIDGSFSGGKIQITSTAGIIASTIQFFGSVDGVNFVAIECRNTVTGVIANNTVIAGSANEVWEVDVVGLTALRCRINAINPAAGLETVTVVSDLIEGSVSDILKSFDRNAGVTTANTQRVVLATDDLVVLATGVNNAVSPTRSMQQGNQYNTVPPVGGDGDMMPNQGNAYGHQEDSAFSRPLGAEQIVDIAPALLSRQPFTVRTAAVLAAAGAYDTPIEIPTAGMGYLAVPCVYTRGLVGGGVRIRVEFADTVSGVDYWGRLPIMNSGNFAAGTDAYDGVQRREFDYYATAAAAETFRVIIPLAGADKIRISCREIGVIGTPGTLGMYGKFSNQPIENQQAADSKAYTPATDSKRTEEISPLSQQYVTEQLVSSTTLTSVASPYYYPSSAGGLMDGYKDLSLDWYLLGNAVGPTTITLTIEASDDAAWTTPQDITRAGYLVTNPAAGGAASYASVAAVANNGILDFDELNCKYWRVKIVVSAANNCTARIWARRKAL